MILITGANGFVGRHVVRALFERSKSLRLVLRECSEPRIDLRKNDDVVYSSDIFRAGQVWWARALEDVDTVVHLAWYVEPNDYLQSTINLDCLGGTLEIAKACVKAGVRRFVGVGSCAEYDLSAGLVRPESPLRPQNLYAACKASTFHVLSQLLPAASIEFAWCRLFYLYGDGEDSRKLTPYLHQQLSNGQPAELTSGSQIRDFLDVSVAGSKISSIVLSDRQGPINVCSGIPVTIRQFAEGIADTYGRRDLLYFGARPDNLFDPPFVVGVDD